MTNKRIAKQIEYCDTKVFSAEDRPLDTQIYCELDPDRGIDIECSVRGGEYLNFDPNGENAADRKFDAINDLTKFAKSLTDAAAAVKKQISFVRKY